MANVELDGNWRSRVDDDPVFTCLQRSWSGEKRGGGGGRLFGVRGGSELRDRVRRFSSHGRFKTLRRCSPRSTEPTFRRALDAGGTIVGVGDAGSDTTHNRCVPPPEEKRRSSDDEPTPVWRPDAELELERNRTVDTRIRGVGVRRTNETSGVRTLGAAKQIIGIA